MDLNVINFSCKFCHRNYYSEIGFRFHIKTHSEELLINEKPLHGNSNSSLDNETESFGIKFSRQEKSKVLVPNNFTKKAEKSCKETTNVLSSTNKNQTKSKENIVKAANNDNKQKNTHLEMVLKNQNNKLKLYNCQKCEISFTRNFSLQMHISAKQV